MTEKREWTARGAVIAKIVRANAERKSVDLTCRETDALIDEIAMGRQDAISVTYERCALVADRHAALTGDKTVAEWLRGVAIAIREMKERDHG